MQIIDAAGEEFAQHGFKNASLNNILAVADVSKGAFYYYFDDKTDLFETVLSHAKAHIFETAAPDFSDLDAENYWENTTALAQRSVAFSAVHPWIVQLARTLRTNPEEGVDRP